MSTSTGPLKPPGPPVPGGISKPSSSQPIAKPSSSQPIAKPKKQCYFCNGTGKTNRHTISTSRNMEGDQFCVTCQEWNPYGNCTERDCDKCHGTGTQQYGGNNDLMKYLKYKQKYLSLKKSLH